MGMNFMQFTYTFQEQTRRCVTAPDEKWIQYDKATGEPSTVCKRGDQKVYLDRHGEVVKTVVWTEAAASSAPMSPSKVLEWFEAHHLQRAVQSSMQGAVVE